MAFSVENHFGTGWYLISTTTDGDTLVFRELFSCSSYNLYRGPREPFIAYRPYPFGFTMFGCVEWVAREIFFISLRFWFDSRLSRKPLWTACKVFIRCSEIPADPRVNIDSNPPLRDTTTSTTNYSFLRPFPNLERVDDHEVARWAHYSCLWPWYGIASTKSRQFYSQLEPRIFLFTS